MEMELRKYEKYKHKLKFMLACSGLWIDHETQPRLVGIALSLCSGIFNFAISYGVFGFCVKYVANISLLTRGIGLFVSFFSSFLKVCLIRFHQDDLRALNSGVSQLFNTDLATSEDRSQLLAHLRIFTKFFYTFDYSVALNVLLYMLIPLSFLRRGKYIRMYPQVLPFSYVPGGIVHWCIYGFEIVAGFFLWSVTCGVDSLFGYYTLQLVGELRLLTSRFRALKSSDSYKESMKDCVRRHVQLTKSHHFLERVFGFLAIWLALTCAMVLCALIFQASQMKHLTALKVCYLVCYSFLKLVQAYSYAWFGNIINVESEACLEAMYDAYWPGSGDTHFMNDVLIVLSQKPLVFTAKSVMVLGLDMFAKIVNTTVSYFFLLQTLDETFN
ncbi:odorant receptor 4-like [Phymastichus coffea]|uniref:odorant receptor 4-like n=1 Tax=Phymastichus coffea TaxID=108790 RepID=UPI00273C7F5E|nr:odorant receptor 4-like [Phymastichus coffea]